MRIEGIEFLKCPPLAPSEVRFPASSSRGTLGEVHLFTGPNGTGKSRALSLLAASTDPSTARKLPQWAITEVDVRTHQVHLLPFCRILKKQDPMLGFAFSGAMLIQRSGIEVLKKTTLPEPKERLLFGNWLPENINQRIANLKVQAAMESMGDEGASGRSLKISRRLEEAVSEITKKRFAVIAQAHPEPKLMFQWGAQRLPIEGLPAGLNSLLTWMFAAATVMDLTFPEAQDPLLEEAFFFLDEPETYLHPEWQRHVLPMAQKLFPNSQFFVATHSPFIVSSLNEGFIYKFTPDDQGLVTVSPPITASKGDSYITAVSEILGLSTWFDPESEALLEEFRALRTSALQGEADAETKARALATEIAQRSPELENIMGMELRQLDRQLDRQLEPLLSIPR